MAHPASIPVPIRLPGFPWGGMTTQSKSGTGKFQLLENCYVSSDGNEIRTFPGYVCVVDPETQARKNDGTDTTTGYRATHIDAQRSPWATAGTHYYRHNTSPAETLRVWTEPTTIHCVEQMGGLWRFVGESDFVREPIYNVGRNAWVRVVSATDTGVQITLGLNETPDTTANTFNAIASTAGVVRRVWVTGVTGALAATLNGKGHVVTNVAGSVITIATTSGGAAGFAGTAMIALVKATDNTNLPISDDVESLTVWSCRDLGDPLAASASETVYPAHVANRQRDFGDTAGVILPGCTTAVTNYPRSRRRQKSIPYRLVPAVSNNRLLLAAPGYGCVFQVPNVIPIDYGSGNAAHGLPSTGNDVYDRPRALGIPKAIVQEDPDKAVGTSLHINLVTRGGGAGNDSLGWGGTDVDVTGRAGTYKFKFAYQDDGTGEVGLCSEPIEITTTSAGDTHQYITFLIYFPGYLLHESLALTINCYRTKKGGDQFYFDRSIRLNTAGGVGALSSKYGLDPVDAAFNYWFHVKYTAEYQSDTALEEQGGIVPDTIEQMPMGCKDVLTIRNWTLFCGALGNAGSSQHLQKGTLSMVYNRVAGALDAIHYNHDEVTSAHKDEYTPAAGLSLNVFEGAETGFGCAGKSIPPAYQGQYITSKTLFPYPRTRALLDLLVNTKVGWELANPTYRIGRYPDVRYSIVDTPLNVDNDYSHAGCRLATTYLELPQGRLQVSEPDNPNIVPATNTTLVSNELTQDIEAGGDAGGQIVACSMNRTYFIGFSGSPIGANPEIASDGFGCIATNSMVSFDTNCAWISERGPCAMMGGFRWIGEPMQRLFHGESAIYLKDTKGRMRHSWGCHDSERGLIYFGVFSNRFAGGAHEVSVSYRGTSYTWASAAGNEEEDEIKSRFPCDEVLVYSYRSDAWSVWRPPGTIAVQWMTEGLDVNGSKRVFFLGDDRRLYALDDSFGLFERSISQDSPPETGEVSTITVVASRANRVGVPVLVCYEPVPGEVRVKYRREIASVGVGTITLDSPITLTGTEWVVVGYRSMAIHTNFMAPKGSSASKVDSLGFRYDMWSTWLASGAGIPQSAFYKMSAVSNAFRDNIRVRKEEVYTQTPDEDYLFMGFNLADEPVLEARRTGSLSGFAFQAKYEFVGSAQVRIHDLSAEVQ